MNELKIISIMLVLLFCLIPGCRKREKGPDIYIEKHSYDFGVITDIHVDVVQHNYKVTNRGTEILIINKVKTSCSCTSMHYPRELLPGESGFIETKMVLSKKMGPQLSSLYVQSNDPKQPEIMLQLQARRDIPFDTSRDTINFETLKTDQVYIEEFEVFIPEVRYKAMPNIISHSPHIIVRPVKVETRYTQWDEPIRLIQYQVECDTSSFVGELQSNIEVLYGDEKKDIPVIAKIIGKIIASPESFYFPIATNAEIERDFTISGISSPEMIKEIKPSDESIVILRQENQGDQIRVVFKVLPKKITESYINKSIEIIIDDEVQPRISVPVLGTKM